jgi:hypothetical protein
VQRVRPTCFTPCINNTPMGINRVILDSTYPFSINSLERRRIIVHHAKKIDFARFARLTLAVYEYRTYCGPTTVPPPRLVVMEPSRDIHIVLHSRYIKNKIYPPPPSFIKVNPAYNTSCRYPHTLRKLHTPTPLYKNSCYNCCSAT